MYFLTKLCCLCLNINKSLSGLDILKNSKILNMLLFCVKDDFDTNSTIPKLICPNCYIKLEAAYHFKKMCLQNFRQFEVYVKQCQNTVNYTSTDLCTEITTSVTDLRMLDDKIRKLRQFEQKTLSREETSNRTNEEWRCKQKTVATPDQGSFVFECPSTTNYISKLHTLLSKRTGEGFKHALINETHNQTANLNERLINLNGKNYVDKLHNLLNQAKKTDESFEKVLGKETQPNCLYSTPVTREESLNSKESYSISGTTYINKLSNLLIGAKKTDESFERVLGKKTESEEGLEVREEETRNEQPTNSCTRSKFTEQTQTKSTTSCEKLQNANEYTHSKSGVNDTFPCLMCEKVYTVQNRLLRHVKLQHSPNSAGLDKYALACSRCGKTYSTAGSLKRHMKIHHTTGLPVHICPLCGNRYKEKSSLSTHMLIHNNQQRYTCQVCGKKYVNRTQYRNHMLRNHTECLESEERKFLILCSVCGKYFPSKSHLDLHFLTHSNEALFSCATCGKKFLYKSTLKRHIMVAHSKRPQFYTCLTCGNQYSAKSNLKLHMLTHADKLPHPCTMCDKAFIRRDKLKVHVWKTHNNSNQDVNHFQEESTTGRNLSIETNLFPKTSQHFASSNLNEPLTLSAQRIKLEPQDDDITIEETCFENILIKEDYVTLKNENQE